MARIKRAVHARKKKKKIFQLAKGYYGSRSSLWRIAKGTVEKALSYAYRDRRVKKRDFRGLWIMRINAAARLNGLTYSQLTYGLKLSKVEIDRKELANLAMHDAPSFAAIAEQAKLSLKA